jgi:cytidylate kinase
VAKITIFGLAGTGTTTIGKMLAQKLGYTFISSGNIFRDTAKSLGMTIYEFDALCTKDPSYDKTLDDKLVEIGKTQDNFVLESRLAWHFIPDSYKVKLNCDFDTRIERVAYRDGMTIDEAREKTIAREKAGEERYKVYYSIFDFGDNKYFDLVIDSTKLTPDHIVQVLQDKLPQSNIIKKI